MQSTLFMRFALKVNPRNMMLFTMHGANVILQANLLIRRMQYDRNPDAFEPLAVAVEEMVTEQTMAPAESPAEGQGN